MIEDIVNKRIHNCLNKINYPEVVTCLIKDEEMEVCFMTEYLWYNPKTRTIRTQQQYKYQGNFNGETIDSEFIDIYSLHEIYLRIATPEEKAKEFDGVKLEVGKRITEKDRTQITKYVANISSKKTTGS